MCVKVVDVSEENMDEYGLFCRKSYMKEEGNQNKVNWLKERFKEGLKHKILYVKENNKDTSRGFIEYIPGEYNWRGIKAEGWMVIHCLWVTGKAKNKGYGTMLLQEAMKDAREAGMHGVVGMTADKQGWIPNPKIFKKNGFEKVDECKPYFSLYAKKIDNDAPLPRFNPLSPERLKEHENGITVFYSAQCPHISDMIKKIESYAEKKKIPMKLKLIKNCKEAQNNGFHPYGIFHVIYNSEYITYKPGMRKETLQRLDAKIGN